MLKTKLLKAGLIGASFVFMAASSGTKALTLHTADEMNACTNGHDSLSILTHTFDSAGYCICLPIDGVEDAADVPRINMNANVVKFVKDHNKKNASSLDKIKEDRSTRFTLIDTVFTKHMLPVELKYLAVIESKLNNQAVSHVGAKGMWQFMPSTARLMGLKIRGKYDERVYTYKSTVAAAKYLAYLYRLFDDWLLTIAAYNAGPGYVYSAIKKSGSRNFWVLQRFLPLETRNHVKKYISVHYYYEGHGGLTTLTKSEREAHIKAVALYVEKNKAKETEEVEQVETSAVTINFSQE